VLGIAVEVKTAGGRTGTITLPGEAQKSVDAAVTLAGTTYNGILTDGLASVSLGDGQISGDLTAQALDPGSRQYVSVSQSALVAVTPGLRPGRVLVWAVVANGALTKALTF